MHFLTTKHIMAMAIFASAALVTSTPVPCPDRTRDLILAGHLDPTACCSYGVCKGDVNVQGA